MNQQEIENYVFRFFDAHECNLLHKNQDQLEFQLTKELDKELLNRPFYWMYMEKTKQYPQPASLHLHFSEKNEIKEPSSKFIHFGSPLLHQIFEIAQNNGKYVKLYENAKRSSPKTTPLIPWLCMNAKVTFQTNLTKELIYSIGLNLIHGNFVEDMNLHLQEKNLESSIPHNRFTLAPIIKTKSGITRIKEHILQSVQMHPFDWAQKAENQLKTELDALESYFAPADPKPDKYFLEKKMIYELYEPTIKFEVINGGLFFLECSH